MNELAWFQCRFWLEQRGRLNAVLRLRLWLTAALEQRRHTGYDAPLRTVGRRHRLLELGLIERKCGIAQVLITCDIDNHASARVIRRAASDRQPRRRRYDDSTLPIDT
jgi:predicted acetyltransferase